MQDTIRLTTAQAIVRFLDNQYVAMDGVETKFVEGFFTIFGHGIAVGLGEALDTDPGALRVMQGRNEQGICHALIVDAVKAGETHSFFVVLLVAGLLKDSLDSSDHLAILIGVVADIITGFPIVIVCLEHGFLVSVERGNEVGVVLIHVQREVDELPDLFSGLDFFDCNHGLLTYLWIDLKQIPTPSGPLCEPAVGFVGTI